MILNWNAVPPNDPALIISSGVIFGVKYGSFSNFNVIVLSLVGNGALCSPSPPFPPPCSRSTGIGGGGDSLRILMTGRTRSGDSDWRDDASRSIGSELMLSLA